MQEDRLIEHETGSIIVIIATDLPMRPDLLSRLARRAGLGIGRAGTPGGNNSGDIFLAFSVANPMPMPQHNSAIITRQEVNPDHIDPLYLAAVEAVEEAVVNAIVAGQDAVAIKPRGMLVPGIDVQRLKALFA